MPTLGPVELIVILVIVTMLFGVGKLPEVFGAVGKGIREFRRNSTVDAEKNAKEAGVTPVATYETPDEVTHETVETIETPNGRTTLTTAETKTPENHHSS